jgi:hypothetical protein
MSAGPGGRNEPFQCEEGDYEGYLSGAMHHASLTGHTLTRENRSGDLVTVSLDTGEDA